MTAGASAELHVFRSGAGAHVLMADGSRIYDIDEPSARAIEAWLAGGEAPAFAPELLGAGRPRYVDGTPAPPPPLYSISLTVAQACNMGCGYCYADRGKFGGPARLMPLDVATAAVDRLIAESRPGADLVLGYMGGEPLVNRPVVHAATRYASERARAAGRRIRFSITTNGTLLRPEDAALFAGHPFTVTVSVDGGRELHDAQRPMRNGESAHDRLLAGLDTLRRHGRPRHLSARVTVTPRTGDLVPIVDELTALGFDEVGVAPVLDSADPALALGPGDFAPFLAAMVRCGEKALADLRAGRPNAFGNLQTALHQIHRGTHRPYPCGAGAAYLSAGAEGGLFACHRLVDDPAFAMGDVRGGSDRAARAAHLARSHVDRMRPCRDCWARYLCGGGCYHEVARRGRPGCDYIRGWLDFCLRAYVTLQAERPEWFDAAAGPPLVSDPTGLSGGVR